MAVTFSFQKTATLSNRRALKHFLQEMAENEGKVLHSLSIVFCSDDYLLDINKRFLQHDYYTDIITFDLSEPGVKQIEAELYISIDRVAENAVSHKMHFNDELHRVVFHGLLHLCGYGDKSKSDQQLMRTKEDHYLSLYVPRGT